MRGRSVTAPHARAGAGCQRAAAVYLVALFCSSPPAGGSARDAAPERRASSQVAVPAEVVGNDPVAGVYRVAVRAKRAGGARGSVADHDAPAATLP